VFITNTGYERLVDISVGSVPGATERWR